MNLHLKAKALFGRNTEKNEVYFTSDGFPFFVKQHAEGHASRLTDRAITTITREEAEAAKEEAPEGEVTVVKPLQKMNKSELLQEAAKRNLTVDPKIANALLVEAIEEADRVAALIPTPDSGEGKE